MRQPKRIDFFHAKIQWLNCIVFFTQRRKDARAQRSILIEEFYLTSFDVLIFSRKDAKWQGRKGNRLIEIILMNQSFCFG